ncbi:Rubredoxin-domain-containing protein (plasmid) [Cupriavidus necator H850]|uniref:rubredoxin n=1 Tax=Cupriavidus necator TaxID=106590 RepID=UPI00129DA160|nr:rubredoxin [Cupriavidus necator]KAI3601070.1 Rubredoxin-domain-containing protein [Cupriavidus necator H850]
MYKKDTAVEIQFSPQRLNDGAGDPYWIDLTSDEAQALLTQLHARLGNREHTPASPLVFSLEEPEGTVTKSVTATDAKPAAAQASSNEFKQWVWIICGWVYDEADGLPEDGIAPGTRWEDIPADWRCPECDVGKEDFAMVAF